MGSTDTKMKIVEVAKRLLDEGGPAAVSTRAVATAAGVHAPAIYRLFGDKDDLMDAVAGHALSTYLAGKTAMRPSGDPVEDLRNGWRLHIGFGLENPDVYSALYGSRRRRAPSEAEQQAERILTGLIHAIAEAGRLAVPEPQAVQLMHAAGRGTIFTLIGSDSDPADADALADRAFEMVRGVITVPDPADRPSAADPVARAATTLRAALPDVDRLTAPEKALLDEWLDRVQGSGPPSPER
ncbi:MULTISPECIES: TetR/AcrR family transcriptional regulator [unclassified Saccharopolyspora]|uniref:TetR/AcrR family transcriptional regulator n=1 Tax=unclassified Saccharopolyspora TaxID=2646250 RepID=UPI001CD49875|nr:MULTISPECIES: TetR/AcrR family transcriptional regulator [unclassified Saccharopolyspora]MCA1186981.1 TetR/AcrR family transcriptional regulator [Saccharopolyspora sp. 6T]MCA1192640.1 TetR/AcrR family transcriptional regulator [Saccharopolyspora sp. 6V]MCA1227740.1 TetR/AcrR family transcriptional regulator [Saccharopolyspora sp. 6M]MCA1281792.1 TetR/AcrR family transcriptional regulator [Saccharopolyspora sp. 7B]